MFIPLNISVLWAIKQVSVNFGKTTFKFLSLVEASYEMKVHGL